MRRGQEMPDLITLHGNLYDAAFSRGNVSNFSLEDPGSAYDQFRVGLGLLKSMSNERKIDFVGKAIGMPNGPAKAEVLNLVIEHHRDLEEPQLTSLGVAAVEIAKYKGKFEDDRGRFAQCNAQLAISTLLKSSTLTDEFKEDLISAKRNFKAMQQDKAAVIQNLRNMHEEAVKRSRASAYPNSLSRTEILTARFKDAEFEYCAKPLEFILGNRSMYFTKIASIADDVSDHMLELRARGNRDADRSRQRATVR